MFQICRLCFKDTTQAIDEKTCDNYTAYKTQIEFLMPEIDLNVTAMFALCHHCSYALNTAYTFKNECLRVEQLISDYQKQSVTPLADLREIRNQQLSGDCKEFLTVGKVKIETSSYEDCNDDVGTVQSTDALMNLMFICDKCDRIFNDKNTFKQHNKNCKTNIKFKTESQDVGQDVNQGNSANLRVFTLKSHSTLTKHISDKSSKVAKRKYRLNDHKFIPTNEKKYFCKVCNNSYTLMQTLRRHEEVHSGKKYNCSMCMKSFSCKWHLESHQSNYHIGSHICETCGKKFDTKYAFKVHLQLHTRKLPYKCEICGKTYSSRGGIRQHKVSHMDISEKNLNCPVNDCNKSFHTAKNLRDHVRRHNLPLIFKCSFCGKGFKYSAALTLHIRTHTGEKPYECSTCHVTFGTKYNLQIHFKSRRCTKKRGDVNV